MGDSYCTFSVAGLRLAVAVGSVQEVLRDQVVTPVPLAHPSVLGVINLRGQIITALCARRRLGLDATGHPVGRTHAILTAGPEPVSLVVDDAGDVVELDPDLAEQVPSHVSPELAGLVRALQHTADAVVLVLDARATATVSS